MLQIKPNYCRTEIVTPKQNKTSGFVRYFLFLRKLAILIIEKEELPDVLFAQMTYLKLNLLPHLIFP